MRALRADTAHCNGKIGVVGASSGGTHAVWVALDTTVSVGWPNWNQNGDDRVDCAVSLSGAYDLSDRTVENYGSDGDPLPHFVADVENYTNTGVLADQKNVSPVMKINSQATFKPLYLFNSIHDSMPYHQIVDMICALKAAGVADTAYQTLTIPNSNEHGFMYWDSWDGVDRGGTLPAKLVSGDVIDFLDAHLK